MKPTKPYGFEHAKAYLRGLIRHAFAYLIGAGLLAGMIYLIDDSARTEVINGVLRIWTLVLGIDALITVSYFIWPKKAKTDK
jgi:hypothetical protein